MRKLAIVGTGDFGIEMAEAVQQINEAEPAWDLVGFVDDYRAPGEEVCFGKRVIGGIEAAAEEEGLFFGIGIADPHGKEAVVGRLRERGAAFATIVAPDCSVSPSAVLGEGCFVFKRAMVCHDTVLGDFVSVGNSIVGGDATVGDFSTTTSYVNVTSCKVGKRVFVGSHSVVMYNADVGDDAFVCVGSIVMSRVKPGRKVMGYPARPVGTTGSPVISGVVADERGADVQ